MKKVMFMIVGMFFSFTVNAAALTLTGTAGNIGVVDPGVGNVVFADTANVSGSFTDTFTLTSAHDTRIYIEAGITPDGTSNTFTMTGTGGAHDAFSFSESMDFTTNFMIFAGTVYTIVVDIVNVNVGSYEFRIETPIPAALFLFAPALLGFFGLRRKAAVAA